MEALDNCCSIGRSISLRIWHKYASSSKFLDEFQACRIPAHKIPTGPAPNTTTLCPSLIPASLIECTATDNGSTSTPSSKLTLADTNISNPYNHILPMLAIGTHHTELLPHTRHSNWRDKDTYK
ncbi:hypothetical protein KCU61_g188, partial [Aureobasidium melanogenum]